jgi:hypothetical protein
MATAAVLLVYIVEMLRLTKPVRRFAYFQVVRCGASSVESPAHHKKDNEPILV